MPMTQNTVRKILDHVWLGGSTRHKRMESPRKIYAGLLTRNAEGKLVEITGKGYARVPLTLVSSVIENRFINDAPMVFRAEELWPITSEVGVFDSERDGNLLAFEKLKGGGCRLGENDRMEYGPGDLIIG